MSKKRRKSKNSLRFMVLGLVALSLVIGTVVWSQNTDAAGPAYFRFAIPKNADGTPISYSPGWFGDSSKCPQNVTVVLYNDKEGYGIAYTTDKFVPKEVTSVSSATAASTVSTSKDEKGVYFGSKLEDRWLPVVLIENQKAIYKEGVATLYVKSAEMEEDTVNKIEDKQAILCPVCREFIEWYYPELSKYRQILTCSKGHRSVTATYEEVENAK